MKTNNLITRFLDGLTSPEEERQLLEALEAKANLFKDERAALDLLCLPFPEEETAALLTEDLSADYDAMSLTRPHHSSFFTLHSSFLTRRFAAVLSIAAVLLIAYLLWPESHKDTITQPEVQPVVAEASQQPIPQPIIEEKKDNINLEALPPTGGAGRGARKKDETVMAEVQAKAQPVREQRKAVKKQSAPIEEPVLAQAEPMIPAEATSQPQVDVQPFHEARVSSMDVGNDVVDPQMLLYTAEIELEKNTHQRQKAYEKEMMQHELELLLYIITNKEDKLPNGTVNTQKS